jgi:hypothetical protein
VWAHDEGESSGDPDASTAGVTLSTPVDHGVSCEEIGCGHIIVMDSAHGVLRLILLFALRLFLSVCLSPGVRLCLRAL